MRPLARLTGRRRLFTARDSPEPLNELPAFQNAFGLLFINGRCLLDPFRSGFLPCS